MMKILLDECLPKRLKSELSDYDVHTVAEAGWSGIKNGELLRNAVAGEFKIFITIDQNLQYQQNMTAYSIGILLLSAKTNRLTDLTPLMELVKGQLNSVNPGQIITISR